MGGNPAAVNWFAFVNDHKHGSGMTDATDAFRRIQTALINQAPWKVSQGYGSFINLHFGDVVTKRAKSGRKRTVGEWHIWIYCCGWRIFDKSSELVAHSESSREEIAHLLSQMQGTPLTALDYEQSSGMLTISFACGLTIRTFPQDENYRDAEYVLLYTPDRHVLSFGPNKELAYRSSDTSRQFN